MVYRSQRILRFRENTQKEKYEMMEVGSNKMLGGCERGWHLTLFDDLSLGQGTFCKYQFSLRLQFVITCIVLTLFVIILISSHSHN